MFLEKMVLIRISLFLFGLNFSKFVQGVSESVLANTLLFPIASGSPVTNPTIFSSGSVKSVSVALVYNPNQNPNIITITNTSTGGVSLTFPLPAQTLSNYTNLPVYGIPPYPPAPTNLPYPTYGNQPYQNYGTQPYPSNQPYPTYYTSYPTSQPYGTSSYATYQPSQPYSIPTYQTNQPYSSYGSPSYEPPLTNLAYPVYTNPSYYPNGPGPQIPYIIGPAQIIQPPAYPQNDYASPVYTQNGYIPGTNPIYNLQTTARTTSTTPATTTLGRKLDITIATMANKIAIATSTKDPFSEDIVGTTKSTDTDKSAEVANITISTTNVTLTTTSPTTSTNSTLTTTTPPTNSTITTITTTMQPNTTSIQAKLVESIVGTEESSEDDSVEAGDTTITTTKSTIITKAPRPKKQKRPTTTVSPSEDEDNLDDEEPEVLTTRKPTKRHRHQQRGKPASLTINTFIKLEGDNGFLSSSRKSGTSAEDDWFNDENFENVDTVQLSNFNFATVSTMSQPRKWTFKKKLLTTTTTEIPENDEVEVVTTMPSTSKFLIGTVTTSTVPKSTPGSVLSTTSSTTQLTSSSTKPSTSTMEQIIDSDTPLTDFLSDLKAPEGSTTKQMTQPRLDPPLFGPATTAPISRATFAHKHFRPQNWGVFLKL